jgi:hypothetical protein
MTEQELHETAMVDGPQKNPENRKSAIFGLK